MVRLLVLAFLAAGLAAPAWAGSVTEAELMAAAVTLGEGYDAHYNAKDAEAMASLYTPDGILVSPGPVVHGSADLKAYYQARFATGAHGHSTRITEIHLLGDGGYGLGRFSVLAPDPAGHLQEMQGNLAIVYRHQADGWHLGLVSANVSHAPPPRAADRPADDEPMTDR